MQNKDVIIVPFHLAWDRLADYQRQTCIELAKHQVVIAYLNNDARFIGKSKPVRPHSKQRNVIFYQPTYPFPFRRFMVIERLNQLINLIYVAWRYGKGVHRVILWIFDPVFYLFPVLSGFYSQCISLYDCVDYLWNKNLRLTRTMRSFEKRLIRRSTYFFVNSQSLRAMYRTVRPPTAVVPQGFRLHEFSGAHRTLIHFPKDRPIVGFVGTLDERVDFRLLYRLVLFHPEWLFVLWGPIMVTTESSSRFVSHIVMAANVRHGNSPPTFLPGIIAQFTVGIIPYDTRNPLVRYSYPMKLFEYFYEKKPVVSSPIKELVHHMPPVFVARTVRQWHIALSNAVKNPTSFDGEKCRESAVRNSWENKVRAIYSYL